MTYNPNIPKSSSSPKLSAPLIQTNFSQFAALFSQIIAGVNYNHVQLNDQHQGKHAVVLMERQSNSPGVTQDLTVLYNKNATSAAGTQPQLFAQIPVFLPTENDTKVATNSAMQLTYNKVNTAGPQYQSFLVGGYILYFGSTSNIANTITLVPTPTKILCVQVSSQGVSNISGGLSNVPYDWGVVVTQPDKIKINSTRAPALSTFLFLAIASA